MQIKEKKVQKFLSKKIQQLNNIVADLDSLVTEIGSDYFRVSIFGSARIKTRTNEEPLFISSSKQIYVI